MDRADRAPRPRTRSRRAPPAAEGAAAEARVASLLLVLAFRSLVEQKLADQVLQHHRRLREADAVALLQHHAVTAGLEAHVLLAENARGQDLGGGVARELVAEVDRHRDDRLVAFGVEADGGDA